MAGGSVCNPPYSTSSSSVNLRDCSHHCGITPFPSTMCMNIISYSEVENFTCYEIHSTNQYGAEKSTPALVMVEQRGVVGAFNQALYYPSSKSLTARWQRPHFARLYLERCTANTAN